MRRERRSVTTADEKRKMLVTLAFVIIILFLGLERVSEENRCHFFIVKNDSLNLYSFSIGTIQSSYASNFTGHVSQLRWGLTDLMPIVQYKYHFVVVTLLLGIIFIMNVRDGKSGVT